MGKEDQSKAKGFRHGGDSWHIGSISPPRVPAATLQFHHSYSRLICIGSVSSLLHLKPQNQRSRPRYLWLSGVPESLLEPDLPDLRERISKAHHANPVQLRWTGILNFPIYLIQAKQILLLSKHPLSKSIYSKSIQLQGAFLFHQNRNRVESITNRLYSRKMGNTSLTLFLFFLQL